MRNTRKKHSQMKVRVNKKAETIASQRNQRRQLVSVTVCGQKTGFVKEIKEKKRKAEKDHAQLRMRSVKIKLQRSPLKKNKHSTWLK